MKLLIQLRDVGEDEIVFDALAFHFENVGKRYSQRAVAVASVGYDAVADNGIIGVPDVIDAVFKRFDAVKKSTNHFLDPLPALDWLSIAETEGDILGHKGHEFIGIGIVDGVDQVRHKIGFNHVPFSPINFKLIAEFTSAISFCWHQSWRNCQNLTSNDKKNVNHSIKTPK